MRYETGRTSLPCLELDALYLRVFGAGRFVLAANGFLDRLHPGREAGVFVFVKTGPGGNEKPGRL